MEDMKADNRNYEVSDNQIKITNMREIACGQKCGKNIRTFHSPSNRALKCLFFLSKIARSNAYRIYHHPIQRIRKDGANEEKRSVAG
jgi:hypothetical protein